MSTIRELARTDDGLRVTWDDGVVTEYLWLWLRDHAHDPATIHPDTHQRQLDTAAVDPGLSAADVRLDSGVLRIEWADASPGTSALPCEFLRRHRKIGGGDPVESLPTERVLWDGTSILAEWPTIEHDQVMDDDDAVRQWLELVARYGFCIVTGTPTTIEATEALARRVGYVRETIFGGMWEFQADLSRADTAYTDLELRPHTDGTYSNDAPGLQLLHCLAFDGTGGESTMVDGFRAAAQLRVHEPELYDVLATVDVPGHYVGDGVHLRASRPILRHGPDGVLEQVSFNNADRAPFWLPPEEMRRFYAAIRAFQQRLDDERLQWRRVNPPGEAILFDNWRVLHGRLAYTGTRHLCGCYLNREDYLSRRRMLT